MSLNPDVDYPSDDDDAHVGMLNENGVYRSASRSHQFPMNIQIWKRNPLFYLMFVAAVCGVAGFGFFGPWLFKTGIALSALLFLGSIWFAAYICDHFKREDVFTKFDMFKMAFTSLIFLSIAIAVVYFLALMAVIRVEAPDEQWDEFPEYCRNETVLYNCIRAGNGIPYPRESTGHIDFDSYPTTAQNVVAVFTEIITKRAECQPISQSPLFSHFRCLTDFWGYPDDIAITARCNSEGKADVWIHSQSRLGVWDFNLNDERVRLLLAYVLFPHFPYSKQLNDNKKCVPTD